MIRKALARSTARVIAGTGSDLHSCIAGGIGALRGPKHGGANEVALEIQQRYRTPDEAVADIRARVARKEVVIGFGHPVYTVADPRNRVIKDVARRLSEESGDRTLFRIADAIEIFKTFVAVDQRLERARIDFDDGAARLLPRLVRFARFAQEDDFGKAFAAARRAAGFFLCREFQLERGVRFAVRNGRERAACSAAKRVAHDIGRAHALRRLSDLRDQRRKETVVDERPDHDGQRRGDDESEKTPKSTRHVFLL